MSRTEMWDRADRVASIEVSPDETVTLTYELFASIMTELGFVRLEPTDGS